jgi:hypothetical protein
MISKLGLRALGLSTLVLGLMAFVSSGVAQAEAGSRWCYINPTTQVLQCFNSLLRPSFRIKNETSISLLFTTAGGTKVAFTCTAAETVGEPLLEEEGSTSEAKAKYTGCKTFLNGVESKACQPKTNKGPLGTIETTLLRILIKLHLLTPGGIADGVLLDTPTVQNGKGETLLATLEMGEECAIGENVEITGDITWKDCQNELGVHKAEHLLEEFPQLRGLRAMGRPVVVDGSFLMRLTGAHAGYQWAPLPSPNLP